MSIVYTIRQALQEAGRAVRRNWRSLALLGLAIAGLKLARLAHLGAALAEDARALQALAADPSPQTAAAAGPEIASARHNVLALRAEAAVFFWASPLLGWAPVIGPDLAAAGRLMDLAGSLLLAADETFVGLQPLIEAALGQGETPTPEAAVRQLAAAQPRLRVAYQAANRAVLARERIHAEQLSERPRALLARLDPLLPLLRGGLAVAVLAPDLLGARGPRTYLVLIQNQDEARGTGGFISAVGALTVERGAIVSLTMEDAYALDDPDYEYPPAPAPLQQYMLTPIMLMRDSNWSPDFPTSAALAERLYRAARPGRIDGVIAFDQTALQYILAAAGPVTFAGAPEPVGAENVIEFMHAAWSTTPEEGTSLEWWLHRKDFIRDMGAALIDRLPSASWIDLGRAAAQALQERHVLIRLHNRQAAGVLAEQGWDGAVRPGNGDFLMVVNSNLGFNKADAIVETETEYLVDLTDLAAPTGTVTVRHFNPARGTPPCRHDPEYGSGLYADLVNRCYWDYLRLYTANGAGLIRATPHNVPGAWLLSGQTTLARVSSEPGEHNTQTFQTLLVVPFGEELETEFRYSLGRGAVQSWLGRHTYRLRLQKQAGTRGMPVTLTVALPEGAQVFSAQPAGALEGGVWQTTLLLDEDIDVQLTFSAR